MQTKKNQKDKVIKKQNKKKYKLPTENKSQG